MVNTFRPRLDILPAPQRTLWPELKQIPASFILYGGTAVALQLGHRFSIDFDFFSFQEFDPKTLYETTPFLAGSQVIQLDANTLTCIADRDGDIKLSFFGLPHQKPVEQPIVAEDTGLPVASLLDLAATKMLTVQSRAQAKDYLDIHALIKAGITLPSALSAARLVYGPVFQPTPTLKALTYFEDGDLPSLPPQLQRTLAHAAVTVDPLRLPSLKRTAGPDRRNRT